MAQNPAAGVLNNLTCWLVVVFLAARLICIHPFIEKQLNLAE